MAAPDRSSRSSTGALIKTRVPAELKERLGALARRRGVKKSAFVRQLIANALGESAPMEETSVRGQSVQAERRVAIGLNAADRRALRERAAARNVRVSRYLSALVRAHLKNDVRPLAAELATLRELIVELNTIGAGLNHLVRAANEGVVWAAPLKETLEKILGEFENLGKTLTTFGQANREIWQVEDAESDS